MDAIEALLELVRQHAADDTRRFVAIEKKLDKIDDTVSSLAETRTLGKGAWKATVYIAAGVWSALSTLAAVVVWLAKGH